MDILTKLDEAERKIKVYKPMKKKSNDEIEAKLKKDIISHLKNIQVYLKNKNWLGIESSAIAISKMAATLK